MPSLSPIRAGASRTVQDVASVVDRVTDQINSVLNPLIGALTNPIRQALTSALPNGSIPFSYYYQSTAQTIHSNAYTPVNFDTVTSDSQKLVHSPSSNWTFVAPNTGLYLLACFVQFASGSASDTPLILLPDVNGAGVSQLARTDGNTVSIIGMGGSEVINMKAGDRLRVLAYQNSGSDRSTSANVNWAQVVRLFGS